MWRAQWNKRPTETRTSRPNARLPLNVNVDPFCRNELLIVLGKLKPRRAAGADNLPPEFFKALVHNTDALEELLYLMNLCWANKTVPKSWHMARVCLIFKKGDPSLSENYRPISLLNLAYKIYAALMLHRLKKGGVDDCIWPTQFGFKAGRGTVDALFIIRRHLERVWNSKAQKTWLLALDWAKAFDSIPPESLVQALKRFGLPDQFVEVIGEVYSTREFYVHECGVSSNMQLQQSGISQGCPLSPYLFVILMSILLEDAREMLQQTYGVILSKDVINELLYADDTLLIGLQGPTLEKYLACIVEVGKESGLLMNWGKVELLTVSCEGVITKPDGSILKPKPSFIYLGSLISADGDVTSELSRRLGAAEADFKILHQVWSHSSLSTRERTLVYTACIVSRLMYGLQAMWLNKASRTKLDAFHARSLRKICGIKPSYYSRVSNDEVFRTAGAVKLSAMLLEQQLHFFGKLARRPADCPVRQLVFDGGFAQKVPRYARRRGRPKLEWVQEIFKVVYNICPNQDVFSAHVSNEASWRELIRKHCRRQA